MPFSFRSEDGLDGFPAKEVSNSGGGLVFFCLLWTGASGDSLRPAAGGSLLSERLSTTGSARPSEEADASVLFVLDFFFLGWLSGISSEAR